MRIFLYKVDQVTITDWGHLDETSFEWNGVVFGELLIMAINFQ